MYFNKKIFVVFVYIFGFLYALNITHANIKITKYEFPNIRDSFCGLSIDYRYCKCAFHNEFCDSLGISRSVADTYVWNNYREMVRKEINSMGKDCTEKNGIWNTSNYSCTICSNEHVKKGNKCIEKKITQKKKIKFLKDLMKTAP